MNKRAVIIAFEMLESIWHMASRSFNTSSFAAFDAPKVELRTVAILEIHTLAGIDYPALKPCLLHMCSRVVKRHNAAVNRAPQREARREPKSAALGRSVRTRGVRPTWA